MSNRLKKTPFLALVLFIYSEAAYVSSMAQSLKCKNADISKHDLNFYELQKLDDCFRFRIDLIKYPTDKSNAIFIPIAQVYTSVNFATDSLSWRIYRCLPKTTSSPVYQAQAVSVEYRDITDYKILPDNSVVVFGNIDTSEALKRCDNCFTNIVSRDTLDKDNKPSAVEIKRNFSFNSLHFDANGFIQVVDLIKKETWYLGDNINIYKVNLKAGADPGSMCLVKTHLRLLFPNENMNYLRCRASRAS
jgi:hypothetical protein